MKVTLGSLDGALAVSELLPGVDVKPLDDEMRRQVGAPRDLSGLVITDVAENSPYASRLTPGMVIVEINRDPVGDLEDARALLKPGLNLLIVYIRGMFCPIAISLK